MSVLSNITRGDMTSATLFSRLLEAQQRQAELKTRVASGRYQSKINSSKREVGKWRTVKDDIATASSQIHGNLGRIKSMASRIENMILTVNKAGQPTEGTTNTDGYSATFDSYLKGLAKEADSSGKPPNLLGKFEPSLTYKTGLHGTTASVQGAYVGSDYYIIDSDGKRWALNREAKHIKRYDDYPNDPTNKVGGFKDGLRLDSISGDNIDFTIAPNTATPESFSGTLHRLGIGIMDSWYYDGLSTDAARDRAITDLKAAQQAVNLEVTRYEVAARMAKFYEDRATAEIKGLREEVNDNLLDQARDVKKAHDELSRQFQAANNNIAHALAMKNQYATMLSPLVNDKFTKILLDVIV
ncbi:MAG TPA: hypothetical protein HPP50_06770 [Rhodospirillaceae bacterium]|jgi:hypothetical protein|nr:hypothetical protein [Rhodospirillaceae bacterium]HIJ93217.1 hypothetical protein [Rhodospirillaceae bacterium]